MSSKTLSHKLLKQYLASAHAAKTLTREALALTQASFYVTSIGSIKKIVDILTTESRLSLQSREHLLAEIFTDLLIQLIDAYGPLYAKLSQTSLARLSQDQQQKLAQWGMDAVYSKFPAMPYPQIERILDEQIPGWRKELKLNPTPLGVASMAQVHSAQDHQGRKWVVKIIKPRAQKRLNQTLETITAVLTLVKPIAFSDKTKMLIREIDHLVQQLTAETDLTLERQHLMQAAQSQTAQQAKILKIPNVHPKFFSKGVLVMEQFEGILLSDVLAQRVKLSTKQRQQLARKIFKDVLIQVFELGIFHADPHAGNLILLEDGRVGLFDWGLTGRLQESDRKHIAALLRAVMARNFEALANELYQLAQEQGVDIEQARIEKELKKLAHKLKTNINSSDHQKKTSQASQLKFMIESSLDTAQVLNIPLPQGLLLMAKSLLTIEGLAKGLDPDLSIKMIAMPILFKAARPRWEDYWAFSKTISRLVRNKMWGS